MAESILIVVPCYNEASRLAPQEFVHFIAAHAWARFIFVDDGSTDGTRDLLEALRGQAPGKISIVALGKNCGKAEAVRQGFLRAFPLGAQIVGYLDADLAAPLDCLVAMREFFARDDLEIVFGSRVKLLGRRIVRHEGRHLAGRLFATVVSLGLDLPIYDTQCGAKLFRVTPHLKRVFSFPFLVHWTFDVEILVRFLMLSRWDPARPPLDRICVEYPLLEWVDKKGSKLRLRDYLRSGWELLRLLRIFRGKSPPAAYAGHLREKGDQRGGAAGVGGSL